MVDLNTKYGGWGDADVNEPIDLDQDGVDDIPPKPAAPGEFTRGTPEVTLYQP